jgi:MoxR-like ATPase
VAVEGFRLVAAMNPFDAVGTARISSAVYDRCCRLSMGYQTTSEEALIVGRDATAAAAALGPGAILTIVELVRATREHPDIRAGSSVRGAIDLALLVAELASLRSTEPLDPGVTHDAAQLSLSGRIRVRDGSGRSAEDVVEELWRRFFDITPEAHDSEVSDPKV